jgi:prepilin-type N-terminal cleavage/methylation domain-containing protein
MIAAGACGFTLIEMMIVIAITAGVAMAIFSIYGVQQRSYLRQEQIVEMQQNVRAFLFFIENDLRSAGFDPRKTAGAGFITARPFEVVFTADLGRPQAPAVDCTGEGCNSMPDGEIISTTAPCGGCATETIRYSLRAAPAPQANGQVAIGLTTSVTKLFNGTVPTSTNPAQDVVESVEALEFLYNLNDGTAVTDVVAAGKNMRDIRSITVSLLVRTRNHLMGYGQPDPWQYPASNAAHSASGTRWGPFTDSFMRRVVITNIQCRNMALQPPEA